MPTIVVDTCESDADREFRGSDEELPAAADGVRSGVAQAEAPDTDVPGAAGHQEWPAYLPGFSLKVLISIAWDVNGDDFLVNMPKWADDDKYDISRRHRRVSPLGNLNPDRNGIPVNIDALRPMIRALLTERFKLTAHMETGR